MRNFNKTTCIVSLLVICSCSSEVREIKLETPSDSLGFSSFLFGPSEEQPEIVGGITNIYEKLEEELNAPPQITERGKVFVQFSLDATGNTTETTAIKGINEAADQEALRAFSVIDIQFTPAKMNGRPCPAKMVLPVTFDPKQRVTIPKALLLL